MAREGRLTALVAIEWSHAHPMGRSGLVSETGMCTMRMRMCGLVRIVMVGRHDVTCQVDADVKLIAIDPGIKKKLQVASAMIRITTGALCVLSGTSNASREEDSILIASSTDAET